MFGFLKSLKSSAAGKLVVKLLWGDAVPPPAGTADFLAQYVTDPWIYTCVWVVANSCARVPYYLENTETGEIVDKHPLLSLLAHPNDQYGYFQLIESTVSYLDLAGDVFWEKNRNKLKLPGELWVLRPDRIFIKPREDGKGIEDYTYKVEGQSDEEGQKYDPKDIVPFKYFHPLDDWRGLSLIRPLAEQIVADSYAFRWIKRFLKRYGVGEGYLKADSALGKPEEDRIAASWGGGLKEDQTAVLPKGLTWDLISKSPREGDLINLYKLLREAKLAVTGVPPAKVGLLEYAKYANYLLQDKAFYTDTIDPKMRKLAGAINLFLLTEYENSKHLEFKYVEMGKTIEVEDDTPDEEPDENEGAGETIPETEVAEVGQP